MRLLEFTVDKQLLRRKRGCDFSHIVAGSIGYLRTKFYFSKEWDDCKKVASFWKDDMEYPVLLDEEGSCMIPSEVLGLSEFSISITGASSSSYKIKTGKIKIKQEVC